MPTGVLHLKEVDTDQITLDGTLSVSGASALEGATVANSTLSVGGTATLADANITNVNVDGTLSVSGQTTIGGSIIPDTNDTYDIGSPEFKIRDLYVSNNSIWVGDDMKISNEGGKMKFRKRKKNVVPEAILHAGLEVHQQNFETTKTAALAHAGVETIEEMKLYHWHRYMRTLKANALITDIFRDNAIDYEETSASDAWKEINDTKIYTDMNVGVGTSDPDDTLHVKGSFKVESETGFKLIRSSVGGTDPTVIIDTQNFGTDETVNDLTGRGDAKYTKLDRVYGRNSEGVGRSWYWGYADDDYSNFSLAFDGGGLPDPDIAFTFTTASELHCNKVFAALGGNADTATKLATPRKINGVDFDGTQDITIDTGSDGVDGITSVNGNICIGSTNPSQKFEVNGNIVLSHGDGYAHNSDDRTLYIGGRNDSGSLVQAKCAIVATPSTSHGGTGVYGRNALHFCVGSDANDNTCASKAHSRLCITHAGNVGIGTTNPLDGLHTNTMRVGNWDGGGNGFKFSMDDNARLRIQYMTGTTVHRDVMSMDYDTDGWTTSYNNLFIYAPDNQTAQLSIHGDNQGTGRLYVGQSPTYGGGIEYNGDNSPGTTGAGADYTTLFRKQSGTDYWTARNYYNSNNWEFRGQVDAAYFGKLCRSTPTSGGYMVGSHSINANTHYRTNPIYTIGTEYLPTDTSLESMYGIGYTHSAFTSILTGTHEGTGWGMYVAAGGYARIGLNGQNGVIKMMCQENGDTYAFEPANDGWLRLQGAASGQGNMHGSYTSLAIGKLYSAGAGRFSDDRLKHFEEPIQNSLDLIKSLNPFKYKRTKTAYTEDWTGEIGEEGKDWDWEMGLIAQEVLKNPDLNFAVIDESKGPENLYGLDYNHFISLLIQGVKDLKQVVDDKDVEIENLKKELNDEKIRMNDVISRLEILENK